MDSDRPANRREEDRLGFTPVADHLAQVIVDQAAKDGLVFGIEGKWGSGKSTLINFTVDALRLNVATPPEIIEFSPWLVGDRDALLQHLFGELAAAASRIDSIEIDTNLTPNSRLGKLWAKMRGNSLLALRRKEKLRKNLYTKINAFGILAGGLSKIVKTSGNFGIPFTELAGNVIESVGNIAKGAFSSSSLIKQKSEIVEALRLLSRRIVIFIDDLDRLEPREASEMLRLIRAVADFPNVVYVLSYDGDVVGHTLESALQVDDGRAYLEKIVQVSFQVPRPEAFDLRRWFQDDVQALFAPELSKLADPQRPADHRLAQAIDIQGDVT